MLTQTLSIADHLCRRLVDALSRAQLPLENEATLQTAIAQVLQYHEIPYLREKRLDPKNRIDFYCQGVGLEVKVKGQAPAIYKQLKRYCAFDEVENLILVTTRSMGLPETINNKPCYVVRLGMAWL